MNDHGGLARDLLSQLEREIGGRCRHGDIADARVLSMHKACTLIIRARRELNLPGDAINADTLYQEWMR